MDTATLEFDIDTTNADAKLGIRVWLNSDMLYENSHVTQQVHFCHDKIDDSGEKNYELRIEMFGKLPQHSVLDDQGRIVSDAMLTIGNFQIDKVAMDRAFMDMSCYSHDFNGTQAAVEDRFFGNMGCNGSVTLKFTTPIYLWLLEIM